MNAFPYFPGRKQSLHPPGVAKLGGALDETRDFLQQAETHQQQGDQSQYFTGRERFSISKVVEWKKNISAFNLTAFVCLFFCCCCFFFYYNLI